MADLILIIVLLLVLGGAGLYIYRAKKRGAKCIGCPHANACGKQGCGCNAEKNKKALRN